MKILVRWNPKGNEKQNNPLLSEFGDLDTHGGTDFTARIYDQIRNKRWWWI